MKVAIALAAVVTIIPGIWLVAQQDDEPTPANDSAKVTYASTAGGYGDLAASHAYEMSSIACELDGKLDSRTTRLGDRVVLKTLDKVITADGTVIPRGAQLLGHVTEVQAYDPDRGPARVAIAFDQAELKKGQNIAIYALIRGVKPAGALNERPDSDTSMIGMPVSMGAQVNGGRMSPDYGAVAATSDAGSDTTPIDRPGNPAASARNRAGGDSGPMASTMRVDGDVNGHTGAHELAAARAVPHATEMPGVLLAGNSTSSGVLLAPVRDIGFSSGTLFLVGVARKR